MEVKVDLGKKFGRFTLEVRAGWRGSAVLLGPNGGGKSTALKCIAGIYNCRRHVVVDGSPAPPGRFLYVPPAPRVPEAVTVADYLAHVSEVLGRDVKPLFGVDGFLHKRGGELSTGMAARVALAAAFSTDKILILDEPLSSLDTEGKVELMKRLAERPFIAATHEPWPFLPLRPYFLYVENGVLKAEGGVEALKAYYLSHCGGGLCVEEGELRSVVGYGF
ncbi:MAG: ATP-binding cassette domain-containing protein [Pyrobaculum sp.]